jgi:hypothetical protein
MIEDKLTIAIEALEEIRLRCQSLKAIRIASEALEKIAEDETPHFAQASPAFDVGGEA